MGGQPTGTTWEELEARFVHHPPSSGEVVEAHEVARKLGRQMAEWIVRVVPPCPERDKAVDAVDLAVMHTNAAIARTQLRRPVADPTG